MTKYTLPMLRHAYPGANLRWVLWCLDVGLDPHRADTFRSKKKDFIPWLQGWWRQYYKARKRPADKPITEKMDGEFDGWLLKQLQKEWYR